CSGCSVDANWYCTGIPSVCQQGGSPPQPVCGNGVIDPGEQCDDGNTQAGDGCNYNCKEEHYWRCTGIPSSCHHFICGNGVIDPGQYSTVGQSWAGGGVDDNCYGKALPRG